MENITSIEFDSSKIQNFSSETNLNRAQIELSKVYTQNYPDGKYFGLRMTRFDLITIAVITEIDIMNDQQTIDKINNLKTKLLKMSRELENLFKNPQSKKLLEKKSTLTNGENYNFLMFDDETSRITQTIPNSTNLEDFTQDSSICHSEFNKNSNVSQMILQNPLSITFARKLFGKEIYFNVKNPETKAKKGEKNDLIENLENIARETLKKDYQINLL
ncbi:hypothetical protein M0811_00219 [Anaeramoeba ignava]|uniref:Uncharacterized protein n=1 Tax=Anaeramoeba ignava TaxID=1746090 RepID=A0A9Q0RE95_ANAIG|nr:hypothetical protein M0811_00219 [Anaeramoeba ignava]